MLRLTLSANLTKSMARRGESFMGESLEHHPFRDEDFCCVFV